MNTKFTHPFTLVEVLIALGICVVGVCSIMVLFPVGAAASRDASMASYAANSADQLLHFAQYCIQKDNTVDCFNYFTSWAISDTNPYQINTSTSYKIGTNQKPAKGYAENSANVITGTTPATKLNSTISTMLSNADVKVEYFKNNVYRMKFLSDTNQDFSCYASMWATPMYASTASTSSVIPRAATLHVEISWPADLDYPQRQKAEYTLDVFKPYPED